MQLFAKDISDNFDYFDYFDYFDFDILADGLVWELGLLTDAQGSTDILRLSVLSDVPSSVPVPVPVPVPAAAWLFGSALVGLFQVAKRRKA